MPKAIIISASTADFFPLLCGMLSSIIPSAARDGVAISIFDLGLTDQQREMLQSNGIGITKPGWDFDVSGFTEPAPEFFKAMTVRPFLHRYFPGYDVCMWIDADAWVQDWTAVKTYIDFAQKCRFAVTPESDRTYSPFYASLSVFDFAFKSLALCIDRTTAKRLAHFPVINAGVFAGRHDAVHWGKWAKGLAQVLANHKRHSLFVDQTVLNVIIRAGRSGTACLPSRFNWMCNRATPMLADDGITLLHPQAPFETLGIIHLTGDAKDKEWKLLDQNGGAHTRSLRYPGPSLF